MLGLEAVLAHDAPHHPLPKFLFLLERLKHANPVTASIAFVSLVTLIACRVGKGYAVKRPGGTWVKYVPEILLVVVASTSRVS